MRGSLHFDSLLQLGKFKTMNIVLLSGGSGKRLWPLSNDLRSKQFIKLLKNQDGQYESMVQRVHRQICEADLDAHIIVATGASQVDSIRSQLGEKVDIVVEPERRDTFPAIALSAVYLAMEKHIEPDEVILVLPVDPYVEIEYFHTMIQMERAVKDGIADIVLMGISPLYPTDRYGYIVPAADNIIPERGGAWPVKQFIEKPSLEKARILLDKGAKWNGGVFAFKLGYLLDIINHKLVVGCFDTFRSHYRKLEKISFDYEVVEKAESVAMVVYNGSWKDLGSWDVLSEEIGDITIGKAWAGEGTERTMIINETKLPMIVLGAKDMIVSASPDGILVSDKRSSSYLKPYVEKISGIPMYVVTEWGDYRITDYMEYSDMTFSMTKHVFIKSGKYLKYHSHGGRNEIWTIVNGEGKVNVDGCIKIVNKGDVIYLTAGQKHALYALNNVNLIEVQIGRLVDTDDTVDYKWIW